jgi:predicted TIM-barrel fold metal-dependent hydrolase
MAEMMISADDHIDLWFLPRNLWTERLPKSLQDRAPHVEERGDTGDFWVCEGQIWSHWTGGTWWSRSDRNKVALDRAGMGQDHTLRPTTPELRLADMERDGVEASVMFGPIVPMAGIDRDLKIACVQAYNDWAADFQKQAPGRFLPAAMMLPEDAEASKAEVQRIAKLGLRQANFLVGTVTNEMYREPWDGFWDAAEECNIAVSYHVGGSSVILGRRANPSANAEPGRRPAFGMGLGNGATSFHEPFVGLFTYGVLERHPRLRFVLAESGTGWIPFVVQEMDYRVAQVLERTSPEGFPLKRKPSEIFREQVWATYQQDLVGLHLIEFFGEGHMMWASDYPHPDSTWPWSQQIVEKETAHLSPEMKRRIVRENAKAFYAL